MISAELAVLVAILVCLGGALLTLVLAPWRRLAGWTALLVTALSAVWVYVAIWHVFTIGPGAGQSFLPLRHLGFALRLHVDGLSAVFLAIAATVALPAAWYATAYLEHYPDYSVGRYHPPFLTFLAAMYGLVSTTDMMWFFFIFWQMMTLPGYALIRFEYRRPESVRAANKYLLMMQIACATTMIGAGLLTLGGPAAATGAEEVYKYDLDAVRNGLPALLQSRPVLVRVAFALFLVGFGIKMGMWPFGAVWLPDAHPAAPSPMSAMLSGVMIKTGVYGLMRYSVWLVPPEAASNYDLRGWGATIALLGTLTLLLGTIQALKQEQSKRLLAFHSIGQIGYILLGTGACLWLLPSAVAEQSPLAMIALIGALFHTMNHALFKALLFLNAGSMLYATGTQDLNRMGGLFRWMPLTALTALIASLAISGVPPLNGFASKWCIYVATVQGTRWAPPLAVGALLAILTSALTLASFIKFFGTSFLSRTSRSVAERVGSGRRMEVPWSMWVPQIFLAAMCVLFGVLPAWGFRALQSALEASSHGLGAWISTKNALDTAPAAGLWLLEGRAVFVPLVLVLILFLMFLLVASLARLGGSTRRADVPWLCGYARETDALRYSAHHFYGEFKRWFRWLGGAPRRSAPPPADPKAD
jgi:hydrogenase-4 component B